MALNELKHAEGATTNSYRKGRGVGSGNGKTSGKGHKGQHSRSGHMKVGFEGGQNPLYRRLPKFGFHRYARVEYVTINVSDLEVFKDGETINPALLKAKGVIKCDKRPLKVLGNGNITKKLTVEAHKFSKSAADKIAKAGGSIKEIK